MNRIGAGKAMATVRARNMTIEAAHQLLGFTPIIDGAFSDWLTLATLDGSEIEALDQIRDELWTYLKRGRISEGQAKVISLIPLLRLAGYHRSPLEYLVGCRANLPILACVTAG
jgi:hypothetical protein